MNIKGESVVVLEAFQGRTILNIWSESPVPQQQVQQHGNTKLNDICNNRQVHITNI